MAKGLTPIIGLAVVVALSHGCRFRRYEPDAELRLRRRLLTTPPTKAEGVDVNITGYTGFSKLRLM